MLKGIEMGRKFFGERNPDEDHMLAALARLEGKRGNLDLQLKYARDCREAGARVYPVNHRYWRASQNVYLGVLLEQSELFLRRAWSPDTEDKARRRGADLAGDLLRELKEGKGLTELRKPHQDWIELLTAGVEALTEPTERSRMVFHDLCAEFQRKNDDSDIGLARSRRASAFLKQLNR